MTGLLFSNLLIIAIYAVCFIFLIRRSRQIALYISGTSAGENVPVRIGKQSLLQVILIGICAATIIHKITEILIYLFEIFKEEAGRNTYNENSGSKVSKYTFKIAAIQTIVALVVLYFSKDISGWFVRKNEADELTFDSNSEN